jgi:Ca2+-binding EF-hand superfamily protein
MKCPPASDEKAFLAKTFKFFDIQNKGSVTQEQFVRSCEKLGVVFPDPDVSSAWLI